MNLITKQKTFSVFIAKFVLWLTDNGYEVTEGESWRPPETAALYAKDGRGISNSLHTLRLAKDLNLFKDGRLLRLTEEYRHAGEQWENMSTGEIQCCWGGRFGDGNHFSFGHNGVR